LKLKLLKDLEANKVCLIIDFYEKKEFANSCTNFIQIFGFTASFIGFGILYNFMIFFTFSIMSLYIVSKEL
jgi:hypothetical protein